MTAKKTLLDQMVALLVQEWGADAVQSALLKIAKHSGKSPLMELKGSKRLAATKPTAMSIIEHSPIPSEKREVMERIAMKYDEKEFLPSVADVREFIILTGRRPSAMRDRIDAFKALVRILDTMPLEHLEKVSKALAASSPTSLGPISDAISAAGRILPRRGTDRGE